MIPTQVIGSWYLDHIRALALPQGYRHFILCLNFFVFVLDHLLRISATKRFWSALLTRPLKVSRWLGKTHESNYDSRQQGFRNQISSYHMLVKENTFNKPTEGLAESSGLFGTQSNVPREKSHLAVPPSRLRRLEWESYEEFLNRYTSDRVMLSAGFFLFFNSLGLAGSGRRIPVAKVVKIQTLPRSDVLGKLSSVLKYEVSEEAFIS